MWLSDHLDMVGVELHATWSKTLAANGDEISGRISSKINNWKRGKFMFLNQRAWSLNCYALSKAWFRCGSVNLRAKDISEINSSMKSWLYADLLAKPSENVMWRSWTHGGLNAIHIKHKAMATLIRTFMETAAIPKFRKNLLHNVMYRVHILEDDSLPDPGYLPYYSEEFFKTIRDIKNNYSRDITEMSIGQWYQALIMADKDLIDEENTVFDDDLKFKICRAEISSTTSNWTTIWRRIRMKGLSNDLISFNLKLLHKLLVPKQELFRMGRTSSPRCSLCQEEIEEDLIHALIDCDFNDGIGELVLRTVRRFNPHLIKEALIRLDFGDTTDDQELPLVTYISTVLQYLWEKRYKIMKPNIYDIRCSLEAKCRLLRECSYLNEAVILSELKTYC